MIYYIIFILYFGNLGLIYFFYNPVDDIIFYELYIDISQ